jgi:hypothetical protein
MQNEERPNRGGGETRTLVIVYGCELQLRICHTALPPEGHISVALQTMHIQRYDLRVQLLWNHLY